MTDINNNELNMKETENTTQHEALDTSDDTQYSDDVQFENMDENENISATVKNLREKLRICEQEKKDNLDGWQRMRADFANARKEEEVRRGDMIKFASEGLVEDMLPVLDSFTMAFANKESWEKVDASWRKGVEYIYTQMFSVLESRGLSEIGAVGEKIDPRMHIAMEGISTDDADKIDTVVEVVQKGYRLHNKVIRPAKVKAAVSK